MSVSGSFLQSSIVYETLVEIWYFLSRMKVVFSSRYIGQYHFGTWNWSSHALILTSWFLAELLPLFQLRCGFLGPRFVKSAEVINEVTLVSAHRLLLVASYGTPNSALPDSLPAGNYGVCLQECLFWTHVSRIAM